MYVAVGQFLLASYFLLGNLMSKAYAGSIENFVFAEILKIPILFLVPLLCSGLIFNRKKISFFKGSSVKRVLVGVPLGLGIAASRSLARIASGYSPFSFLAAGAISKEISYMTLAFVISASTALGEEMLFRGLFQEGLQLIIGNRSGLIVSVGVFSILHMFSPSYSPAEILLETIPGGFATGFLYLKTRELTGSISVHFFANFLEFLFVLPLA
jgi:membrane protease YdiL (CAAX protease family)